MKQGVNPHRIAGLGVVIGIFAFSFIVLSHPISSVLLFKAGVFLIGCGGGFFSVSCLVSAMKLEVNGYTGLALGAWGAVHATAFGIGVAMGGILRDIASGLVLHGFFGKTLNPDVAGYLAVYHLELFLLFVVLVLIGPLVQVPKYQNKQIETKFGLSEFPS